MGRYDGFPWNILAWNELPFIFQGSKHERISNMKIVFLQEGTLDQVDSSAPTVFITFDSHQSQNIISKYRNVFFVKCPVSRLNYVFKFFTKWWSLGHLPNINTITLKWTFCHKLNIIHMHNCQVIMQHSPVGKLILDPKVFQLSLEM